ncbi:lectin-domain containing receptor kinase VI.3 [Ricinus communis]|uniref:non-specific serine/threonine protein kinase n=1 Tax=Ricinus communis TaxID=3988 RepID=B9SKY8_RICCO|nr:lectin-domain containing receptor kinase VI.3 [Ricinus communis]EEF35679.1 kinase, putative [Ricinus communis]|eukprot:XP_002526657.3 lectin-domain containing receptor kinase VI.3 [Ricinus communis]
MAASSMNSVVWFIFLLYTIVDQAQSEEFTFNGFNGKEKLLALDRASVFKPSGALRLTNKTKNAIGHAFYSNTIQMFNKTSPNPTSFQTTFVFSIVPPASGEGGFGFGFALSPTSQIPGAAAGHYLGLFNNLNNGESTNHIFAVEFDTVKGFNETGDTTGNHIGININSMDSNETQAAAYISVNDTREDGLNLHDGKPIQAWVEYDGAKKVVTVTICPMGQPKPVIPLINFTGLNLSEIVKENTYVGFSASTGENASSHYILGWSFSTTGAAPALNLDELPMPPDEKDSSSFSRTVVALISALCVMAVLLIGILLCLTLYKSMATFESLEDWELECPHRFGYRDLYTATKGFKESEIIGVGGFGIVYKAVMRNDGNEVAVKKITRNSVQGLKEFSAEIESLGRLRHKHLVNLQGWCKRENDLFLVYDYIPNGSLDSLLFHPKNNSVLSWDQRFNIVKGIAAGLLYLHEEWDQVVIHRDVKSSNVLIDAEMNGRLGDFGLARLYDHGINSHTTSVVGTIGYIAPELARTGKASTSSDVFAYGVLLLEVATGRRPIGSGQFILVDWVLECQQVGKILDAVDPNLNSNYTAEEVELVLELGLLCAHQNSDSRPSMRQVTTYLNGDYKLPVIEDWGSYESHHLSEINSRLLKLSNCEMTSTSYRSSSIRYMSTSSIDAGR